MLVRVLACSEECPLFVAALLASFVAGIVAGLFIDHAAAAIPNDRRLLAVPGCHKCGEPWRGVQLLPVLGPLLARSCTHCGEPISPLRPLTELATGVLFALAYWRHGPSAAFVFTCAAIAVLLVILRIDWRHHLIYPNTVMLGIVLAFGYAAIFSREPHSLLWSTVAAIVAAGLFLLFFFLGLGLQLVLPRWQGLSSPLGSGDIMLAAMMGAMTGPNAIYAVFYGMIFTVIGGLTIAIARTRTLRFFVPLGAYLCASTIATLLIF
jgi:prepilin signal peptidase PulO-like enzyme (type II secretory pathway)